MAEELGTPYYEAANILLDDRYYDNLSGQQAYKCFACEESIGKRRQEMVQTAVSAVTPFRKVDSPLRSKLQFYKLILVSAVTSPVRIATWKRGQNELKNLPEICAQLIELIYKFPNQDC